MIKLRPHQERIVKTMTQTTKGQVIVPTGGGKTMCMITDAQSEFQYGNQTIVVVAPRILLAQQLSSDFLKIIDNARVLHVHSGCLLYTSPSPRDGLLSRMPSSA